MNDTVKFKVARSKTIFKELQTDFGTTTGRKPRRNKMTAYDQEQQAKPAPWFWLEQDQVLHIPTQERHYST